MPQGAYKDLSGRLFSRLLVVRDSGTRTRTRSVLWECLCECGNTALVQTHPLLIGRTRSCGCLQREHISRFNRSESGREYSQKGRRNRVLKPDALKHTVFDQYKKNAEGRNLSFELSFEQALELFLTPCNYCGIESGNSIGSNSRVFRYNGIDRVDNDRGYDVDNVVSCCRVCNYAKRDMSRDDFLSWARRVVQHSEDTR
jgi:hypothetical protein